MLAIASVLVTLQFQLVGYKGQREFSSNYPFCVSSMHNGIDETGRTVDRRAYFHKLNESLFALDEMNQY